MKVYRGVLKEIERCNTRGVTRTAFRGVSRGHGVLKKLKAPITGLGHRRQSEKKHLFRHIIPPYALRHLSMRLACDFPRWTGGTPTAALWRLSVAADAFPHEDLDRIQKMIRILKNSSWPNSPPPFGRNPLLHSVNSVEKSHPPPTAHRAPLQSHPRQS
jgi:hypothetical protein